MAEPDFDQILEPLIGKLSDTMDPDNAADFVRRTMRQVWNARGKADMETLWRWVRVEDVPDVIRAVTELDR